MFIMRIRLRAKKDGEVKAENKPSSGGFFAWLRNLGSSSSRPVAGAPAPCAPPPPQADKRWISRGASRYFVAGRSCIIDGSGWRSEYLFDVHCGKVNQQVRIVLPEPLVARWEKSNSRRMPEATRLRIARETLEALIDLNRLPQALTVSPDSVTSAKL